MGRPKTNGEYKLTDMQWAFVREYVKTRSILNSALAAGYAPGSAQVTGSQMLAHPGVSAAINKLVAVAEKRTGISVAYVLERLKEVAERCMQGEPVLDKEGNETGQWKFDAAGANRALELLGKHLRMFAERIEVDVSDALADRLARARQRLASMQGARDAEFVTATLEAPNPSVASSDGKASDNDLGDVLSIPD